MRRCDHLRTRCIHGDEINSAMTLWDAVTNKPARRARCLNCGKALLRSLPDPCVWTGEAHPVTDEEAGSALPLHRTEAGWPRCSTCDGGGCPDCTDPA